MCEYGKQSEFMSGMVRELNHPRVVGLRDIYEIDSHTFATVLEVCRGGDLESYLQEHQVPLSECSCQACCR